MPLLHVEPLLRAQRIELREEQVAQCRAWNDAIMRRLSREPNYTGFEVPDRYFTGYLGEVALGSWARSARIEHKHYVRLDGRSQTRPEFTFGPISVEVKTAGNPRRQRFMVALKQHSLDAHLYVGARVAGPSAIELWGWLSAREVAALPVDNFGNGPTRWHPYRAMHHMSDLQALFGK